MHAEHEANPVKAKCKGKGKGKGNYKTSSPHLGATAGVAQQIVH